jgi:hypothetical protein
MPKPFEAAQIKVERAKHHLQELRTEIDNFFQRGGAYVAFEIAGEFPRGSYGGTGSFTYREKEPIPTQWSAIIGDILHNLRASLDLIACDLCRMTGGDPNDVAGVLYPFCKEKGDLSDTIHKRRLGRIGKEFREIIEQTKPYRMATQGSGQFMI